MFENFREKLHMVQQDFSTSFKTLGDLSKDTKIKRKSRLEEGFPYLGAGLEILNRFEKSWFLLRKKTKDCAQVAESVDGDIVMLSAHWERRKAALTHLQEQLQSLPDFISDLDAITANIAHLEGEFEEMESRLLYLETLCCQCEQQNVKNHHMSQLEGYKKKKRKEKEVHHPQMPTGCAFKVIKRKLLEPRFTGPYQCADYIGMLDVAEGGAGGPNRPGEHKGGGQAVGAQSAISRTR
uniref:Dysbindin-A-like n=1 Tax=Fundulus heteroclitus TaxID=8078 RepID=A0A3Q2PMC9_FUNHE